jgi:hypothetical protein
MGVIRIGALCALAALALSGMGADAASALPELGRCVAKAGTGRYKDSNCRYRAGIHAAEKLYEWQRNASPGHFSAEGGEAVIEEASGTKVVCMGSSSSGEYVPASAVGEVKNVVLALHNCLIPPVTVTCQSPGASEFEFVTSRLKGKLAYISGKGTKTPVVGQVLAPEAKGSAFREWECSGGALAVEEEQGPGLGHATVIAEIGPANTMSTAFSEEYKGASGVQEPQHTQGSTRIDNLEASVNEGAFELDDQVFAMTITNEEALEIKA